MSVQLRLFEGPQLRMLFRTKLLQPRQSFLKILMCLGTCQETGTKQVMSCQVYLKIGSWRRERKNKSTFSGPNLDPDFQRKSIFCFRLNESK